VIARARLAAQAVTAPLADPVAVVRRLLAMQGQDYPGTLWAVGLRCGATAAAVEAALEGGDIVRTWPMRGTLHLLAAEDARWMLELLAPRSVANSARNRASLGLDDDTLRRARAIVERALAGQAATRREILDWFAQQGIAVDGQRGYHLLFYLATTRVLVQRGRDVFALLDEWVAPADPLPREEALARLALRYFTGHGPATEADLAHWTGLPLRDVRMGIAANQAVLERTGAHWAVPSADPPPAGVHLLPGFDEMLLGYRDRTATLDPAHAERICPGGNGVFRPTVLVEGRVVGTWRAPAKGQAVAVEITAFDGSIPASLRRPAARYAAFLGKTLAAVEGG
jgi:hypothetical protein